MRRPHSLMVRTLGFQSNSVGSTPAGVIEMKDTENLVFVGRIVRLDPILGADFILSATVICGPGGKWEGVVKKSDFQLNDLCVVFLPDSLLPQTQKFAFMESSNWRVKMRKFKGAASEVLIVPYTLTAPIGADVTDIFGVTKYHKPVPAHLQGIAKGNFPDFIPKTDEPNYQRSPELVEVLSSKPWYITEKCDGSSTTAFKYKEKFGICSRNLEVERNEENGYWKVARQYHLEDRLPEGIAIQWETCGPGIQSNPMGLKEIDGFAFNVYDIEKRSYLQFYEFKEFCELIGFPTVRVLQFGQDFIMDHVKALAEGCYKNGKPREGIVIRSQANFGHSPISFKVINLCYER